MGEQRLAEAPGSRTQPSRSTREATDFEDREGHRAPFASSGPSVQRILPGRSRPGAVGNGLTFDQANLTGAGTLAGLLGREFHPLAFAQQLEHRTPNRAAVEEMLDAAFVADKPEALVDQQPCDRP